MELMAKAGYDPRAAIRLWEILNEAEEDVEKEGRHEVEKKENGKGEEMMIWDHVALLRTHPTGKERLQALEKRLPRAMEMYKEARASMRVEREVRLARRVAKREDSRDGEQVVEAA
jgi:predicted Zn-dependent protease